MGVLIIETRGSFPWRKTHSENAQQGGHAAAIGRGIEYLSSMLPAAIELDHRLHTQGDEPQDAPFGKTAE